MQSAGDPPPEYAVIGETGPDHHKTFQVEVRVGGNAMADASGRSKKEAEQEAARLALEAVCLINLDDAPGLPVVFREHALMAGRDNHRRFGVWKTAERVDLHFARDVLVGWA